jgi:FixJ family two-component response regulator
LHLPGQSGEALAKVVAERRPGTPVILLTGWSEQLRLETPSLPGVARVLGKPVQLSDLADALASVCPG